jgi:hypothetical protein
LKEGTVPAFDAPAEDPLSDVHSPDVLQRQTITPAVRPVMVELPARPQAQPTREFLPTPQPFKPTDDLRAIASALTVCGFLWAVKLILIFWYIKIRNTNPLADAPALGVVFLGGADFFFCACLALLYRAIYTAVRPLPQRAARTVRSVSTAAIHIGVIVFSLASFLVTRMYSWPLDIGHLRSADDPKIVMGSLTANAELLPLLLLVIGLILHPLLVPPLMRLIGRLRWRARLLWLSYGAFAAVLLAGWTYTLKGIDTYGVKDNAFIYFASHYKPPLRALDAEHLLLRLAKDVAGRSLADARSHHIRSGVVARDFPAPAASAAGFNVVLIQLESTSSAHLDEQTTPNLTRLARTGVSFRNHATTFSETTRASFGIYFSDYLIDLGTSPRLLYQRPLPRTSIAQALQQQGYDTAVFHSGFLSYADLSYLFEQTGFETIVDAKDLWKTGDLPWSWGVREEETVDAMNHWLDRPRKDPFFLLYATEFPHHPYVCPIDDKPYPETSWLNRYRNALHYADRNIGVLIDRLEKNNLLDKTIIVVTGDHGETVSSYPVGHGLALTREEIFTPFIVSNPKLFPQTSTSNLTTNHLDIAPTILAALNVSAPSQWLGRNVFANEMPARLMFVQAKLAQIHGVIDNGLISVYECGRKRQRMYDYSTGGFELLGSSDLRTNLMPRYNSDDELFQKWSIYSHVARATGHAVDSR